MAFDGLILVTGATGYVGGRLIRRLVAGGYRVRVLVRDGHRLQGRAWLPEVDVVQGDALKPETLPKALEGVEVAYYLIHSMAANTDFHARDMEAARNFGQAAREVGVRRIIYLGGLGDPGTDLSPHLRSRHQTGEVLRQSGVPVTEFQAAIIVGSGSVSFEMIRYLTERMPLMMCPAWVHNRIQPIGIRNVLEYLIAALDKPESAGCIIEIGGADVLTYREMLREYARMRGLNRYFLPVSIMPPRLAFYCIYWVTPVPSEVALNLIEGLRNEVVVRDDTARELFPDIEIQNYHTAVELALKRLDANQIESSWRDALIVTQGDAPPVVLSTHEGMIIERRQLVVRASPETVYKVFARVGGERGWPYMNWAWVFRGVVDRMVGGVGFRRGRRHPLDLRIGDALDYWRVEAVEESHMIRLRSEMRMPGPAWLEFEVVPAGEGKSLFLQTAFFAPKGLWGNVYWYGLYPIHSLIFSGMIRSLAHQAEESQSRGKGLTPLQEPSA